jgi:hypothetical protein
MQLEFDADAKAQPAFEIVRQQQANLLQPFSVDRQHSTFDVQRFHNNYAASHAGSQVPIADSPELALANYRKQLERKDSRKCLYCGITVTDPAGHQFCTLPEDRLQAALKAAKPPKPPEPGKQGSKRKDRSGKDEKQQDMDVDNDSDSASSDEETETEDEHDSWENDADDSSWRPRGRDDEEEEPLNEREPTRRSERKKQKPSSDFPMLDSSVFGSPSSE